MRCHPLRRLFVTLALVLIATGCGGGERAGQGSTASPSAGGTAESATGVAVPSVTGPLGQKPTIARPQGTPPRQLLIKDLAIGKGPAAQPGATVTVRYVGVSWSNGQEFDSSWAHGQPVTFALKGLIAGWQEGIPGMRVGGRRLLVVPPDKGYGPGGSGPIGPNETLVFVIDLVKVA